QFASTPFTTTLNPPAATKFDGVPVFPVPVPGAAVSPGTSNCNFANAPGFTETLSLLLVFAPSVTSEAVTVWVPAVLNVRFNVFVPFTNAAFAGRTALGSVLETETV